MVFAFIDVVVFVSLLPLPWLEATWFKMLPSKYKADMSYYCNPHLKNTTMKYTLLVLMILTVTVIAGCFYIGP